MIRRPTTATVIASVALFFTLVGSSHAASPRVAALQIQASGRAQPTLTCTGRVSDPWRVAIWAYVNGREIRGARDSQGGIYFKGQRTLVQMVAIPHNGPICAWVVTRLPVARILVAFRVLSTG